MAFDDKHAVKLLRHAAWHCLFGSEGYDRTPEQGDKDAAILLFSLLVDIRATAKTKTAKGGSN